MARTVQRLARLAFLGFAVLLVGCGPKEIRYAETGATLEGTVSYGNQPVGVALVIAQNSTGSANGFVDDDGRYRLQNVPLGEVNVAVDTAAGKGQAMGKFMADAQGKAKGAPKVVDVPAKYADPAKSGIKTKVNKGANTFDVVIPK